ncbi:MAG TPA: hypothetical protein VFS43_20250 [Polyangiaceae bacterium]|nr:hypothetical protein [Polyangiaceae bacterium]
MHAPKPAVAFGSASPVSALTPSDTTFSLRVEAAASRPFMPSDSRTMAGRWRSSAEAKRLAAASSFGFSTFTSTCAVEHVALRSARVVQNASHWASAFVSPKPAPHATSSQGLAQRPTQSPGQVSVWVVHEPSHLPLHSPRTGPEHRPSHLPLQAPAFAPVMSLPSHLPVQVPSQVPVTTPSQPPWQAPGQRPPGGPEQVPSQAPEHLPASGPFAQTASPAGGPAFGSHAFMHSSKGFDGA